MPAIPKLDALVQSIDQLRRLSKKKLHKQLSEIRRGIRTLKDVAALIEALLENRTVRQPGACKPSWERAAEICRSVRRSHPRASYKKIHAIAQSRGKRVPARWQTLERQNQAYWRWRNNPPVSLEVETHRDGKNTPTMDL